MYLSLLHTPLHWWQAPTTKKISIQILIKMFGGNDATDWMFYSGILIAFMALAINGHNLFEDTNHPALKNRYREAKNIIDKQPSKFDSESIEYRLNIVGDKLNKGAKWCGNKW
ncbi:hypothetical protein [Clostridium estertheticum]|uniref:hypothetical protein n=1 Tax=Clostridium estertheticum TaxID=238834 RepID=UPI001CF4D7C6|nr:hypothetical protein [Clostridium estertheticum]MCB2353942.1 hypothetical protein [Clostridium estertheticum]WAG43083.1 hypothetical protein LL065_10545 [Clostridium estertheticum]